MISLGDDSASQSYVTSAIMFPVWSLFLLLFIRFHVYTINPTKKNRRTELPDTVSGSPHVSR